MRPHEGVDLAHPRDEKYVSAPLVRGEVHRADEGLGRGDFLHGAEELVRTLVALEVRHVIDYVLFLADLEQDVPEVAADNVAGQPPLHGVSDEHVSELTDLKLTGGVIGIDEEGDLVSESSAVEKLRIAEARANALEALPQRGACA